jgi:23S rRNA (guanosine2251-2'-O)-methyltransferase
MNNEFVYGKNSVAALLTQSDRTINKIFILSGMKKDSKVHNILKQARQDKIPVTEISKSKLDKILDENVNHQGILASVSPINYAEIDEIIQSSKECERFPLVVLLDNIEDPQNLGSIIRSAEVMGANGVIIPLRKSAVISGTVAKASSGALEFIPIARVNNLVKTIEVLKKSNFWVVGAEYLPESQFVYEIDYKMPVALVVGSEGKGISRLVRESCDLLVKIPQLGRTNSLNAANALSIVLYEIVRQRSGI